MNRYLGKEVEVTITKTLGYFDQAEDIFYPCNYGYVELDGNIIEGYVLGVHKAIKEYKGLIIGIVTNNKLNTTRLIFADKKNSFDKDQIKALTTFREGKDIDVIAFDWLKQSIRNTGKALITRNNQILTVKTENTSYHVLPGGGIEFREGIDEAIVREVKEELGVATLELKPFAVINNLFEIEGIKAHEIIHVYKVEVEESIYEIEEQRMDADIFPATLVWLDIDEIKRGDKIFYPKKLIDLL